MNIAEQEKQKYSQIWNAENYTSGSAIKFAEFVKNKIPENSSVLEIGCGNGTTMKALASHCHIYGNDITVRAASENGIASFFLYEHPIWDFPKMNFDYTISTDVLEHIPPKQIQQSIKKIIESSNKGAIHAICTRPASRLYQGQNVHLTVQPISWWKQQFEDQNERNIEIILIDTNELR